MVESLKMNASSGLHTTDPMCLALMLLAETDAFDTVVCAAVLTAKLKKQSSACTSVAVSVKALILKRLQISAETPLKRSPVICPARIVTFSAVNSSVMLYESPPTVGEVIPSRTMSALTMMICVLPSIPVLIPDT